MNPIRQIANPPVRSVMIYDGDCGFCKFWIRRWQLATENRVDCLAYQEERVMAQFSEIPRQQFESAVQLIEPTGTVYHSAEAVFRSLAFNPRRERWLRYYERSLFFRNVAEWSYRFIARHRPFFSFLTNLFWRVPKES